MNQGGVAAAMAPGAPCAPAGGPPGGPPGGAPVPVPAGLGGTPAGGRVVGGGVCRVVGSATVKGFVV